MQSRFAEMSVLAVTALLVLSVAGPGMVAGAAAETPTEGQSPSVGTANAEFVSSDEYINTSQNVTVWERAALPLRVQTDNAATTVDGPRTNVVAPEIESGEGTLNKDTFGVFDTNSTISLDFQDRDGADTTQFSEKDVQLVAARLNESADIDDVRDASDSANVSQNTTIDEAIDLLLDQNLSSQQANENFTFSEVGNGAVNETGAISFDFEPTESGQYAFALVASDSGEAVDVTTGNISVSEDIRLLGVDGAPVQETSASAEPIQGTSTVDPGENVTFDVDSKLGDQRMNHTVVLFNESVLEQQSTTVTIDGEINRNLSGENVTVEHSVEGVDGVAQIDAGTGVMGVDLTDRSASRSVTIASLVDFLANETDRDLPETDATDDAVLNASVTSIVSENGSETIDVGTSGNWTNGTYQYVYVASTNDSSKFSTTKGNVTVGAESEPDRTEVQLNLTANQTTAEVNETIRLTATREDTGARVTNAELTVGNSEPIPVGPNGQARISFTTATNVTVELTKEDTPTETFLSDSVDLTIEEATTGGGGGPPAGGGGQPPSGGDSGEVDAVSTSDGATVNFRSAPGGQPVSVAVPNVASDSGTSAVTGVELTATFSRSNFRAEFTRPTQGPPEGTPALDSTQGSAVSYFTAEAIGITDDEISEVSFTFTLSESEIPDGRSTDEVRLFRHVDGEWTTLETTHLGGDEFRARSPGFTAYAIGFQAQQTTETPNETVTPTPSDGEMETDTPTDTATAMPTPGGGGGIGTSTIAIVLVVLLALGAGAYLYYREQNQ